MAATRMINGIAQTKKRGDSVCAALINSMFYKPDNNHWAVGFYRQNQFLKDILKKLESSPNQVENQMNQLRFLITNPSNLTIHLSVNASLINEKVSNPEQFWIDNFLPENIHKENVIIKNTVDSSFTHLIDDKYMLKNAIPRAAIAGIGSVESNFMFERVQSIDSYKHPDLASLLVLMQYLTQIEVLILKIVNFSN